MDITSFFNSFFQFISSIIELYFTRVNFTMFGFDVSLGWLIVSFYFFVFCITVFWIGVRR